MSKNSSISLALGLTLILLALGACAEPTPEERLERARSRYEASVNAFSVQQVPLMEESAPPSEGAEGEGEAAGEEGEGDETADVGEVESEGGGATAATETSGETGSEETEEPVALRQDVLLDVVIRHDSNEKLDGITVDISMVEGEREIQVWRVWFDTSAIEKGPGTQFSHTLENVDYQPGYGFGAEIRHPVPPEDRAEYREYANLGG